MTKRKGKIIILLAVLTGVSIVSWGKMSSQETAKLVPAPENRIRAERSLDTALMNKAEKVWKQLDWSQNECFIQGIINSASTHDSTANVVGLHYLLSKSGNDFYYRLGETETINANGLYLYIDHSVKKILLSSQRDLSEMAVNNIATVLKNIVFAEYEVKDQVKGNEEEISFLNENHLNIKEYSIVFDNRSLKPINVRVRASDSENPAEATGENVMEFRIESISDRAGIEKYIRRKFVRKEGAEYKPLDELSKYELVQL